jgi:leucyl/phenylalanyl-tRNA--protein transferase
MTRRRALPETPSTSPYGDIYFFPPALSKMDTTSMSRFEELMRDLACGQRAHYFPKYILSWMADLIAEGGVLTVDTVLEAYSKGCFPWTGKSPIPWCSPDPRMILCPRDFHISRSLGKLIRQRRYEVFFDRDFRAVMRCCASICRKRERGTWITRNMLEVYGELHDLSIAHSVEVYRDDQLCGGLYGLSLGGAFLGESMFAREANTSKLALYALCHALSLREFDFIDCQQDTPHLGSLGAKTISRQHYLRLLQGSLQKPSHHYSWKDWKWQFG